jgi:hypothetical protein
MRTVIVLFLMIGLCQTVFTQSASLESQGLRQVLAKFPLITDSGKQTVWVNKTAKKTPSLAYFKDKHWWHIKGILTSNCYSASDSIHNVKMAKQEFELTSDNPSVKWVDKKWQKRGDDISLYVYKRFYYCDKIYVLLTGYGSPFSLAEQALLAIFDKEGNFVAVESVAWVR